jgi:hypothetical protein
MTTTTPPSSTPPAIPSPEKTLRKLFLTLFLRGRSSRGLQKDKAPKSVGHRLFWSLVLYSLFGLLSVSLIRQPIFLQSAYLHAMTFILLGMFIASSAGEVLFNKEEADILLHRPITPKSLLWAKVRVLVEVSLWLAAALNFVGLFVGMQRGGPLFPLAHIISTTLQAMFCTGSVVLLYQLCLRWFGRERLDGLMTTAQVVVSVGAVLSGQIVPQLIRVEGITKVKDLPWWVSLLPPAWFAGFDDAIAGTHALGSWLLAAVGTLATTTVLWLSFGILARDYELGLQSLNENVSSAKKTRARRRWMDIFINLPPFRWWLRDPVARASFVLSGAYMLRDRDVKLRLYPSIAPMMIMPVVMMIGPGRNNPHGGAFGAAFAGAYVGLVPFFGLTMIQYSQQWRAADIFRSAPIIGPARICDGARKAVLCILGLPSLIGFAALIILLQHDPAQLRLLLPGVIALPVYALFPGLLGSVPLSQPTEEAKSVRRSIYFSGVIMVSLALAGAASAANYFGYFWHFLAAELLLAIIAYVTLRILLNRTRWEPLE